MLFFLVNFNIYIMDSYQTDNNDNVTRKSTNHESSLYKAIFSDSIGIPNRSQKSEKVRSLSSQIIMHIEEDRFSLINLKMVLLSINN